LIRHVVIVGAGPGGLAAAINLAGLGFRVTIVEKDAVAGGRAKSVSVGENGEYTIDGGPTIISLPEVLAGIFERAGKRLEDYVELRLCEPAKRVHFWDGTSLDIHYADVSAGAEAELRKFGDDKPRAFRNWVGELRRRFDTFYPTFVANPLDSPAVLARALPSLLRARPWQSLYHHVHEHLGDERLVWAFAYMSKYVGVHPREPATVFGTTQAYAELAFGLWHVRGGTRALIDGMVRCARDLGVELRLSSPVERIWIEEGVAKGVLLAGGERLAADAVVVNADLPYAATKLIDARWRGSGRMSDRWLSRARYSGSTVMFYLGLDRRYDELPHHIMSIPAGFMRTRRIDDMKSMALEDRFFYVCNPARTDPSGAPPGHSTLCVLIDVPDAENGADWEEVLSRYEKGLPKLLASVGFADVEKHIRARRTATPVTWRDAYNVHRGATFSLALTLAQSGPFRPRGRCREIDRLFFVGGGTHPGTSLRQIFESSNVAAHHLCRDAGKGALPGWPRVPDETASMMRRYRHRPVVDHGGATEPAPHAGRLATV
jgi:phytoene desaturase